MAPLQKAGIVALIKNRTDDMTLAIGDGKHLNTCVKSVFEGLEICSIYVHISKLASTCNGHNYSPVPFDLAYTFWVQV